MTQSLQKNDIKKTYNAYPIDDSPHFLIKN